MQGSYTLEVSVKPTCRLTREVIFLEQSSKFFLCYLLIHPPSSRPFLFSVYNLTMHLCTEMLSMTAIWLRFFYPSLLQLLDRLIFLNNWNCAILQPSLISSFYVCPSFRTLIFVICLLVYVSFSLTFLVCQFPVILWTVCPFLTKLCVAVPEQPNLSNYIIFIWLKNYSKVKVFMYHEKDFVWMELFFVDEQKSTFLSQDVQEKLYYLYSLWS